MSSNQAPRISFDPATGVFLLPMRTAFYGMRVLPDGQLVHLGFGVATADTIQALQPECLDAYEESNQVFDRQGRRYEFPGYGDISYHDSALKVSFPQLAQELGAGECAHLPVRDLRLRYVSHEVRMDARPGLSPEASPTSVREARPTLCVRLKDALYDFYATLFYRVSASHNIVERWVELENQTSMTVSVEALDFGVLHVPNGRYEITHAAGIWAREFIPTRHLLQQGTFSLIQKGLNTGHESNPIFQMNEAGKATEDSGEVYFGALAYSGNWNLRFEQMSTTATRVFGGYERGDFGFDLQPGESHRTPAMILGCSAEGRGGASRAMHGFIRDCVLPEDPLERCRPVLYNSWEAAYFDLSTQQQIDLARQAASIGVELFCVDDAWFGGRRHERAGLGDWFVSDQVFPEGLQPLVSEVRRLGMKFGLWFEPEMVNPDSDLYRQHPDWVLHFPGRPRSEMRNQLILDFGRQEVCDYLFQQINSLVGEYGIDFIKWDMNRYATEAGSVAGRGIWRKHVEGVYSIMDRLRANHPQLRLQSCSGGGGRVDAGILARVDQVWTSDNTDANDRTLIQEGFTMGYPQRVMESWVTHEKNHQTGRNCSLQMRFDVAMRGALGIGLALNQSSEEELATCQRMIAFYKTIREVVQWGDLYRLSSGMETGVSAWLNVLPDASRAVYSHVVLGQLQGVCLAPFRLKSLEPSARYRVSDDSGNAIGTYSGAQLMTLGLPLDMVKGGTSLTAIRSRTVLLERVGEKSVSHS